MKVGIESIRRLEELAKQQVQIWNDSCDYGLPWTQQLRDEIVGHLHELLDFYRWTKSEWSNGSEVQVHLQFATDEAGTIMRIGHHRCRRKRFFSIDFTAATALTVSSAWRRGVRVG